MREAGGRGYDERRKNFLRASSAWALQAQCSERRQERAGAVILLSGEIAAVDRVVVAGDETGRIP